MKKILMLFAVMFMVLLSSCKKNHNMKIVNWNVQTFFDAEQSGVEYKDFVSSKNWGTEAYQTRLKRLCSCIKAFDADILVMEEVENTDVINDIYNFLYGEWNFSKQYKYSAFTKEKNAAFGIAVLSRLPILSVKAFGLSVTNYADKKAEMPSSRPLLEVSVGNIDEPIFLYANHWKSMSGGKEESEKWRDMQENVLCSRIALCNDLGQPAIVCGDFNRDIYDFDIREGGVVTFHCKDCVTNVFSSWLDFDELEEGSYFYKGEWSKIDNFFYNKYINCIAFKRECNGPWCDEKTSEPNRYKVWTGEGYSDHLPISCIFTF